MLISRLAYNAPVLPQRWTSRQKSRSMVSLERWQFRSPEASLSHAAWVAHEPKVRYLKGY